MKENCPAEHLSRRCFWSLKAFVKNEEKMWLSDGGKPHGDASEVMEMSLNSGVRYIIYIYTIVNRGHHRFLHKFTRAVHFKWQM